MLIIILYGSLLFVEGRCGRNGYKLEGGEGEKELWLVDEEGRGGLDVGEGIRVVGRRKGWLVRKVRREYV